MKITLIIKKKIKLPTAWYLISYMWDFEMGKINQVYTTLQNYVYERIIVLLFCFFFFYKAVTFCVPYTRTLN